MSERLREAEFVVVLLGIGVAVGFALGTIHGVLGPIVWVIEAAIIVGLFVIRRARRLGEEPPRLQADRNEPSRPTKNAGTSALTATERCETAPLETACIRK